MTTDDAFLSGETDLHGFTPWWEGNLPSWLILYCRAGEATLSLQFKRHTLVQGMVAVIPHDMFPSVVSTSPGFRAFYLLADRDFVYHALYDVPNSFYDAIYIHPLVSGGETAAAWASLAGLVCRGKGAFRKAVAADLLHAFALSFYNKWLSQYGDRPPMNERSPAEELCVRFYNLVSDHFREKRSTEFYAGKLCISPSYLAMVTRQVCGETPKEAIDRQVVLEMKHTLRSTTMTMKEIADSLHFPDASYMCRFFRRHTGQSLSEYRRVAIGQESRAAT